MTELMAQNRADPERFLIDAVHLGKLRRIFSITP